MSEFKKVCGLSKTTELSVSFGEKKNWDEFLEVLKMLVSNFFKFTFCSYSDPYPIFKLTFQVDKVPIKDSKHWPRSASAPESSHEYKFVIQLGGRISQKNLSSVASCFKTGFSVLIQNMGSRQEDMFAPDTLHGSKRNPRFHQVAFVKGK
jgi:hypothetical protein